MAAIIEQFVGIDRCQRTLHTLFALELIELGRFEWRRRNDHEWEVGRWPGLELTLLAQPEWRSQRVPFAICPFPGNDGTVPFILLIAFQQPADTSRWTISDTSVSVSTVTTVELQRDVRICAHQIFDAAVWLQLPHLEARHMKVSRRILSNLPCMKATAEIQSRFTAPATAVHMADPTTSILI